MITSQVGNAKFNHTDITGSGCHKVHWAYMSHLRRSLPFSSRRKMSNYSQRYDGEGSWYGIEIRRAFGEAVISRILQNL